MILASAIDVPLVGGVPRECGDDPIPKVAKKNKKIVFPANAGMIPNIRDRVLEYRRVPRECGDDPRYIVSVSLPDECSPRMRG